MLFSPSSSLRVGCVTITRGWAKQKSLMVCCQWPCCQDDYNADHGDDSPCFYFAGWQLETGCGISVAAIKKPVIVWLLLADHTRGQWTKHRVRDCDFYQTKMSKKIIPKSASRGLNLQNGKGDSVTRYLMMIFSVGLGPPSMSPSGFGLHLSLSIEAWVGK